MASGYGQSQGQKRPVQEPQDPEAGERTHFNEVCWSLLDYGREATFELQRLQHMTAKLNQHEVALWQTDLDKFTEDVSMRIQVNSQFLKTFPSHDICGAIQTRQHASAIYNIPPGHKVEYRNSSKVRSTLRQFVRDWAAEGKVERDSCYAPAIEALRLQLPPCLHPKAGQAKPRVLCPGSGLGRLPFDLLCMGYAAQQNEFSYHMIMGAHLIFNRSEANGQTIFPYILDLANRKNIKDNLRAVKIPDICLQTAIPDGAQNDFSMASGEFVEVYKDQVGEWDAVVTCFFLDTAKNVFLYIRTLAAIIRCGGAWVNLGPLLFHYAETEGEISIELSWEEVRPAISKFFDIVAESFHESIYTVNQTSMKRTKYKVVLFTAVRNATPLSGSSNPVY